MNNQKPDQNTIQYLIKSNIIIKRKEQPINSYYYNWFPFIPTKMNSKEI